MEGGNTMNETHNTAAILSRDWDTEFIEYMKNRILVSHYKYGWVSDTYGKKLASALESLKKRVELYEKTGNTEWLVDVANFAMIEFGYPTIKGAHFRATDSHESPGLVGISAKELLERK